MDELTKKCRKCAVEKPISEFYETKVGVRVNCDECASRRVSDPKRA